MSDNENLPSAPAGKGARSSLDILSNDFNELTDKQRSALQEDHAKGMLEVQRKAANLKVDVAGLSSSLHEVTNTVADAASDDVSVTVTHTHNTSNSRTEVIMGNTDHAQKGKLSKSQTGETNWTPVYILAGIAAFVFIAISISS